jgi:hypothetical protein
VANFPIKPGAMQQKEFSPEQSIQLIDSMINKAKNQFSENGLLYLLWGWTIFACAIGHFVLLEMSLFERPEIIWATCWIVVIFQVIYLSRARKKEKVKTYSAEIIGYVWITFGICLFLVGFILGKDKLFAYMYPLFLVLYGIPTFLSGVIMRFTPLKVGGIMCWVLSLVAVLVIPNYTLLLLAVAVAIAWIIPGYLLQKRYKLQNS